ncbi:MAG: ribosome biogenesis/translation initiation ATPase RLI [Ignisphaera sp.]|nr:ribosome biogenesis/translation initiation ATPase RLI [Ignisphaera sp.]MDW8085167.1 ribosome biogenesis/translation initiation ATPase RLI [Ignisphaera sp.]
MARVATIDYEMCHPDRCGIPCVRFCPINKTKPYKAIELSEEKRGKPVIYEERCIACGICVKKCPYRALSVVNLPEEVEEHLIHRYGQNAFKLYGLPMPIEGKIVGILGPNGIGKSTAMKILSGSLTPNIGRLDSEPSKEWILEKFRGSVYYDYFNKLYQDQLKIVQKIQYIELVPRYIRRGSVDEVLKRVDERGMYREVVESLHMNSMLTKHISTLSGGELQKLSIAAALLRDANVYIFDEPTSFLDIRERLNALMTLDRLLPRNSYIFIVDHDLMFLDYIADLVTIAFGVPGSYGMFSKVYTAKAGIDHYLKGFLPSENMRIRNEEISFKLHEAREDRYVAKSGDVMFVWNRLLKQLNGFTLTIEPGQAYRGEVVGIVGPNAIGKTTFVRILVGELEPDAGYTTSTAFKMSYKPQYLERKREDCSTVAECLKGVNSDAVREDSWLYIEVVKRLGADRLLSKELDALSGGELQKFYIAYTLIKDADIYLLDEPSSHIDVEDQLSVARVIKRIARLRRCPVFVIDHNFLLIDYSVDRLMVFSGTPGREGYGSAPDSVARALNSFLKSMNITVRRDPDSGRPRINKPESYLDRQQKALEQYFYIE